MTHAVDTDYLTLMRADLVAVLEELAIPWHDHEPRSLGEAPAAWFGRPAISFDTFDHAVLVDWPMTLAGHPIDGENTTHDFDATVWELWRHLGAGRRAMVDGQRSVRAVRADPAANVVIGENRYPTYEIQVQTTIHVGLCA